MGVLSVPQCLVGHWRKLVLPSLGETSFAISPALYTIYIYSDIYMAKCRRARIRAFRKYKQQRKKKARLAQTLDPVITQLTTPTSHEYDSIFHKRGKKMLRAGPGIYLSAIESDDPAVQEYNKVLPLTKGTPRCIHWCQRPNKRDGHFWWLP